MRARFALACGLVVSSASGADRAVVDRTAVRFFSPETGGPLKPRYITARRLAFEARLEAARSGGHSPDDSHIRAALDRFMAEELLFRLPLEPEPDVATVERVAALLRESLEQGVGGASPLASFAEGEGLSTGELRAAFTRQARAALYVEDQVSHVLYPTDEQLREAYRGIVHPFRSRPYDTAKREFQLWYVGERLRTLENSFLQGARMGITIVFTDPLVKGG